MTNPGGRLWVNPEGVSNVGDAYGEHVQLYQTYLEQLTSLRARYGNAWGDDDMGTAFSKKFLGGMDNLEQLIGGIKGTLDYTAAGLRESGKLYREVDDEARDAGHQMAANFDSNLPQMHAFKSARAVEAPLAETETQEGLPLEGATRARRMNVLRAEPATEATPRLGAEGEMLQGELTPMHALKGRTLEPTTEGTPTLPRERGVLATEGTPLLARQRVAMRSVKPDEATEEGTPLLARQRVAMRSVKPGEVTDEATPMLALRRETTPALRREAIPAEEPLLPAERNVMSEPLLARSTPAMPAISSYMMKPEYASAYVGGEPLPEGYRLEALNPFPDGNTRVDANLYDSITPLGNTAVTTPDGQQLDAEGRQFFVVKENPNVDATAAGYQPLFLSYSPDGTPTPLIPGE
ncbi:hypothetical protein GCM10010435_42990 [Winogradskya consettensis]|uniref:WXG100 family type VII secretion target n=1 Tax=Winogradskya consettensis TaxID=113560 RepID=A0A919VV58_9ACTN|nr:hypothetical protein [Actinoplanes consettensis]GIM77921.1 hypothetical protein Aco04nite_57780 [Actinoplanes consettensis]